MAIIRHEIHWEYLASIIVKVEWLIELKPKPPPQPTQEELNTVPTRFRCMVCLRMRGKRHFACLIAGERVCRRCYPYVDVHEVAYLARKRREHPALKRYPIPLVVDLWEGVEETTLNDF